MSMPLVLPWSACRMTHPCDCKKAQVRSVTPTLRSRPRTVGERSQASPGRGGSCRARCLEPTACAACARQRGRPDASASAMMKRTASFALAVLTAALLMPPVSAEEPVLDEGPLGAEAPAWRAALAAARMPGEEYAVLRAAYEERAGHLWMQDGIPSPQAVALAALIARADERGLSADDYGGATPGVDIAGAAALGLNERAVIDVAFSSVVLAFVSDLGLGRIHPHEARWHLAAVRAELPLAKLLGGLASASDVDAELDAIEMPLAIHRRTRLALALYRALAAN